MEAQRSTSVAARDIDSTHMKELMEGSSQHGDVQVTLQHTPPDHDD
jgi:hypothetical protein